MSKLEEMDELKEKSEGRRGQGRGRLNQLAKESWRHRSAQTSGLHGRGVLLLFDYETVSEQNT